MVTITVPTCPHCGTKMISDDGDYFYCMNDCDRRVSDELANLPPPLDIDSKEYAEGERDDWYGITGEWYSLPWEQREAICWKCYRDTRDIVKFLRTEENDTGTYGHTCPLCGYNLELHPKWGKGGPADLAIHRGKTRNEI